MPHSMSRLTPLVATHIGSNTIPMLRTGYFDISTKSVWTICLPDWQRSLDSELSHPRAHTLISSMVSTMNAILPVASTYIRQRAECAAGILQELYWAINIMYDLVRRGESNCEQLQNCTMQLLTSSFTSNATAQSNA